MQRGHKMTLTKQEKKLMLYLFPLNPPLQARYPVSMLVGRSWDIRGEGRVVKDYIDDEEEDDGGMSMMQQQQKKMMMMMVMRMMMRMVVMVMMMMKTTNRE
jgi:hypothetical protein